MSENVELKKTNLGFKSFNTENSNNIKQSIQSPIMAPEKAEFKGSFSQIQNRPAEQQSSQNENNQAQYQQEALRLYIANVVLTSQVKSMQQENRDLISRIERLEKSNKEMNFNLSDDKKRRHRRSAREIERHYTCPVQSCQKSYGSEGSLAQHMKLKHPEIPQDNISQNQNNNMISGRLMSNSQQIINNTTGSNDEYSNSEQQENNNNQILNQNKQDELDEDESEENQIINPTNQKQLNQSNQENQNYKNSV